jgi:SEC-C motif
MLDPFIIPELAPSEKMGRNDPCWCLSGRKWKDCHREREFQKPINVFQVSQMMYEEFAKGYCLHPEASPETCSKIINAHTIQRNGGLSAIAELNHVLSKRHLENFQITVEMSYPH